MIKTRMRRSDIFKTLTACIIMNDQQERSAVIARLKTIGIKHFVCYPSFEAASADFKKFYSIAEPDFIITNCSDVPSGNLPVLEVTTTEEDLKLSIMQMFKRKFKLCRIVS